MQNTSLRHRSLDVLRGIAILGTLGTNIFIFIYSNADTPFDSIFGSLTNGKFLALLTMMFGIGLAIQQDSALRKRERWPLVYLWRGVLLFLDGVVHYILVFQYDVLMAYATTGIVVAYILSTSRHLQRWIFGAAIAVHLAFISLPVFGVPLPLPGGYGMSTSRDLTFPESDAGVIRNSGDFNPTTMPGAGDAYLSEVQFRLETFWDGRAEAMFILPMSIAMFLFGAWAYRNGVLDERGTVMRRWLMGAGAIAFAYDMLSQVVPAIPYPPGNTGRYGLSIIVAFGILAAIPAFYSRFKIGWLGRRLEDVGRMALTTYIGQNVIATLLFSTWALNVGRFLPEEWGMWRVAAGYLMVVGPLMVFAYLWRLKFARGPVEWLWNVSYDGLMRLTPSWRRKPVEVERAA